MSGNYDKKFSKGGLKFQQDFMCNQSAFLEDILLTPIMKDNRISRSNFLKPMQSYHKLGVSKKFGTRPPLRLKKKE